MEITKVSSQVGSNQPIDPKVKQALEDIDQLNGNLGSLFNLVNNEQWHDFASIQNLKTEIANESNALEAFMAANPSSFTPKEIDIAKALVGGAGNLQILPPQDKIDILHIAGVVQGIAQALHDLLVPSV